MEKILGFQLSLFGSFINIQPNQELTMRLMSNLADENMIPATATVSTVDPAKNSLVTETRLQMVSQDKSWIVVFFQERIDITYSYNGGSEYFTDFSSILLKGLSLLKKTFSTFSETTGNRLAVNTRVLLKDFSREEENAFIRRFSNPLPMFDETELNEWNVHYNMRRNISFSEEKTEICNNIVDIGDLFEMNPNDGTFKKRMSIGIDINTLPEKQDFRFGYVDLIKFAEVAQNEMERIIAEVEEE